MTKKRPGPLAPPDRSRPSRKTTALSYSWTTFTVTQSEKGSVTRTSIKETKVRNIAQIPGPSGSAEKRERKKRNKFGSSSDRKLLSYDPRDAVRFSNPGGQAVMWRA